MENVTFAFCILLQANGFERFSTTRSDKVSQFFRGFQKVPGTTQNRSFGTTFWRLIGRHTTAGNQAFTVIKNHTNRRAGVRESR